MPLSLKDFVRDAVSDIISGISEAQEKISDNNIEGSITAKLIPNYENTVSGEKRSAYYRDTGQPIDQIDFDIAVTTADTSSAEGSTGIQVVGFRLGGKADQSSEQSSISRVRFKVPVAWPTLDPKKMRTHPTQAASGDRGSWMS